MVVQVLLSHSYRIYSSFSRCAEFGSIVLVKEVPLTQKIIFKLGNQLTIITMDTDIRNEESWLIFFIYQDGKKADNCILVYARVKSATQ